MTEQQPVAWLIETQDERWLAFKQETPDAIAIPFTETPLYAHPPAAPDTVTIDRPLVEDVLLALRLLHSYGCPACSGDCASANPPMIICPMADGQAAIFKLTEALK